jgi:hypothetical protein
MTKSKEEKIETVYMYIVAKETTRAVLSNAEDEKSKSGKNHK